MFRSRISGPFPANFANGQALSHCVYATHSVRFKRAPNGDLNYDNNSERTIRIFCCRSRKQWQEASRTRCWSGRNALPLWSEINWLHAASKDVASRQAAYNRLKASLPASQSTNSTRFDSLLLLPPLPLLPLPLLLLSVVAAFVVANFGALLLPLLPLHARTTLVCLLYAFASDWRWRWRLRDTSDAAANITMASTVSVRLHRQRRQRQLRQQRRSRALFDARVRALGCFVLASRFMASALRRARGAWNWSMEDKSDKHLIARVVLARSPVDSKLKTLAPKHEEPFADSWKVKLRFADDLNKLK